MQRSGAASTRAAGNRGRAEQARLTAHMCDYTVQAFAKRRETSQGSAPNKVPTPFRTLVTHYHLQLLPTSSSCPI